MHARNFVFLAAWLICSDALAFEPSAVDILEERLGRRASAAVMARTLLSEDGKLRRLAANGLEELGPDARPALKSLILALSDKDEYIRASAARALGSIGPRAKAAVPNLITLLNAPNWYDRQNAGNALGNIRAPVHGSVEALIVRLKDDDSNARLAAIRALGRFGPAAKPAVSPLINLFQDTSQRAFDRWEAARVLGRIGPNAKRAVPTLRMILDLDRGPIWVKESSGVRKAEEAYIRITAAEALWRLDRERRVITWLIDTFENQDIVFYLREGAAEVLAGIGSDAKSAVPALTKAVDGDNEYRVTDAAIIALGEMGDHARTAVRAISEHIGDNGGSVSRSAVKALTKIGPSAKTAVPYLIHALKFNNEDIRVLSAEALWSVDRRADLALPILITTLDLENVRSVSLSRGPTIDGDGFSAKQRASRLRRHAAKTLGDMGPIAKEAVPGLTRLLDDEFITVREAAAEALEKVNAKSGGR